ncbi:uncharacterized protein TNIN_213071 [Trichonephila inaurata madagascariensis]|uniref:Uncharacterized protein n=1 Tax=Trichonephila inaurata madagascariensis TaxID=2747483 RepID=A0A8X6XPG1_9ARAC|nr:uncharacterized protein TNIN_213071 [Trichonephila inaurata madagascariensis]
MNNFFSQRNGIQPSFPEQIYFQNCFAIGQLPSDINMDLFYSFFQDILFWKTDGSKIIPDLQHPDMKAVILSYENEELVKLCAFRAEKALSRSNFTLYDGHTLFMHFRQLDIDCDPRCRNVFISGLDVTVPKEMYFDLFKMFGALRYWEFCFEGDISKARFEFTRVTSSFAAVLSLQSTLNKDAFINLEVPLFPVTPISPCNRRNPYVVPAESYSPVQQQVHFSTNEIKEQYFLLCSMNTLNYCSPEERCADWGFRYAEESTENIKGALEECSMGTLSFEFSRKRMRNRGFSKKLCRGMLENFGRVSEENRRLFLQAAKRKILSYCI